MPNAAHAPDGRPADGRRRLTSGPARLVLLLAVLLAAAAVLVPRLDASVLKPRIEAAFEHATGRALTIGGTLRLSLLPVPGFVAHDVSLANLPGGTRPVMAHVETMRASVDPFALFARRIHVRSVTLVAPDILFERVAGGSGNWVFQRAPGRAHPPTPLPGSSSASPSAPAGGVRVALRVSSLDIEGGRLAWDDPGGLGSGEVAIDSLHAQQHDENASFTVVLDGHRGPTAFTFSLASAPPEMLGRADAGHPFPLRATLSMGDDDADRLMVDGSFAEPLRGRGFEGLLAARLRQLADLDALFPHAGLPHAADLVARARVRGTPDGRWALSALEATSGRAEGDGFAPDLSIARLAIAAHAPDAPVTVAIEGTYRGTPFSLEARQAASLSAWTALARGLEMPAAPLGARVALGDATASFDGTLGAQARADAGVALAGEAQASVPDPARLAALFGARLDRHEAVHTGGHLSLARAPDGGITAAYDAATLAIGRGAFPPSHLSFSRTPARTFAFEAAVAGQAPWLDFGVAAAASPPVATLRLDAHRLPAAPVLALLAGREGIEGELDLTGTLTGTFTASGGPPRIEPATLAGPVSATLVDGMIGAQTMRDLLGPVLRAAHLPGGARDAQHVRCAGLVGRFGNGTLALTSVSLDSRMLLLDGSGTIGLADGALALRLVPALRLGGTAATAPVTVGGTLASPAARLAYDAHGRVGFSIGGGAPASVACDATPGLPPREDAKPPKAADILRGLGLIR